MDKKKVTRTKGDVIVEEIKVGDIHYEYEYNIGVKCKVLTLPRFNEESGLWEWESENLSNGRKINYGVHPKYPHYAPNLYTHEAYNVKHYV